MKLQSNAARFVFFLAIVTGLIAFSAFRQKDSTPQKYFRDGSEDNGSDTTTRGKRDTPEMEFNMEQLDEHMKLLEEQVQKLVKQQHEIDFTKLQFEIDEKLKTIDFDKISKEIEVAMKHFNAEKVAADASRTARETAQINIEVIKKEMKRAQLNLKEEHDDLMINTDHLKQEVEHETEKAKVHMEEAREQLSQMKKFTDELAADGLINKKKAFKLEIKEGELYIDGNKQPAQVQQKYQSFLKSKNMTINNDPQVKQRI